MVAKKPKKPKPGVYHGVSFEEYLAWSAVSNSVLSRIASQSPAHAKEFIDNPPEQTDAQRVGSALHKLALECETFFDAFAVAPAVDRRTRAGKEAWESFKAANEGKVVLKSTEYEVLEAMAKVAGENQVAMQYIQNGESEVSVVWKDKDTGVLCKCRIDYVHWDYGVLIDLKSTRNSHPRAFASSLMTWDYHQQAAFYRDGFDAITDGQPAFVFVVIEKEPPYAMGCYELGDESLLAGRQAYKAALKTYKKCVKSGVWPDYAVDIYLLNIPDWALYQAGIAKGSAI